MSLKQLLLFILASINFFRHFLKANVRYGSPTSWEIPQNKTIPKSYYSDSDASYQSEDDLDYESGDDGHNDAGLKIEFKSDNVAEAIETEQEIQKRQRQLEIINDINANEKFYQSTKNIGNGFDFPVNQSDLSAMRERLTHELKFQDAIEAFENRIRSEGILVRHNEIIHTLEKRRVPSMRAEAVSVDFERYVELFSFMDRCELAEFINARKSSSGSDQTQLSLDDVLELNRIYFERNGSETYIIEGSGSLFDKFNDSNYLQSETDEENHKLALDYHEFFADRTLRREKITDATEICMQTLPDVAIDDQTFSFDRQPNLINHPGASPSIILQALTMSNANDGINLERLETIGDSFLKYAITTYLYCTYENVHEGKLSHLRSRQVSNLNLYRLGRRKMLGESMIATKFEPHDNWLPPCYYVPKDLEKALIEAKIPACYWDIARLPNVKSLSVAEICQMLKVRAFGSGDSSSESDDTDDDDDDQVAGGSEFFTGNENGKIEIENSPNDENENGKNEIENIANHENEDDDDDGADNGKFNRDDFPCFIPYNLVTQHSIPDKSIADCVEALIGAYLIDCGPRGALLFMAWLGIRVLPCKEVRIEQKDAVKRVVGSTPVYERNGERFQTIYGYWAAPKSPLLHYAPNPYEELELLLDGYSEFEEHIGYKFNDRSYLLQAMTHGSYSPNRLTDCYQRLEFLGDAVLDYLITRHLYEDPRQHSPGALTDLRSALVNNTIFASLAIRHGFHKYFRHLSPGLNDVIDRFVRIQHENGHSISEEFYLLSEDECDEAEDVEVPKAAGDVFESVAGAIFLDSNMSLDTVWRVSSQAKRKQMQPISNTNVFNFRFTAI